MKSYQDPLSLPSLQELINELENLIVLESSRSGKPWLSITKLTELFGNKHKISPEEVALAQGYSDGLRSLFINSRRFSIYGTQIPQRFYVALLAAVVPNYAQDQTRPIQYKIKKHWQVDGNLIRMLEAEGAEEISSQPLKGISTYHPILLPQINSVDDLKIVLMEIIKSLMINHTKELATVGTLSKKFNGYYGQPIRTVVRRVCSDMRLIHVLEAIPNLYLQKMDHDWQITFKVDPLK